MSWVNEPAFTEFTMTYLRKKASSNRCNHKLCVNVGKARVPVRAMVWGNKHIVIPLGRDT